MSFDPRAAMRRSIRHLTPYYRAPEEPLRRMDQNTNLYGANPVLGKVGLDALDFNQYPTRDADRLLDALAARHGLPRASVLAANGSDETLDLVLKAFTDPGDRFVTPDPSYSLYPFYGALHGLEHTTVPLDEDWTIAPDALIAAQAKVLLIASPNNPTGRAVPHDVLVDIVTRSKGVVVIDEAYQEYSTEQSMLPLIETHRNLIVLRTFSKAYALAGARLGWLAAHPDTAEILGLVKPPFNVNVLTEALGVAALQEHPFVEAGVRMVHEERPRLAEGLAGLGFTIVPSDANFILSFPPEGGPDGPTLAAGLRQAGIAARTFAKHPRLARSIRFTVGRAEDNDALLSALRILLEGYS